jgi:hypothetical protein
MTKTLEATAPATEGLTYLTKETAHFSRSAGGLLALTLTVGKSERHFDRVVVFRAFPLTSPFEFLSVRDARDTAKELGLIRSIADLDEEGERLVRRELESRYFIPAILRIYSMHRRGSIYLDVETDIGRRTISFRGDASAIRTLDDGRVIISDLEGNSYQIPDPAALDKASYRRIEIYL